MVPERLGGQGLEGWRWQSTEARAGATLPPILMAQSGVTRPKALSPQGFWGVTQAGCTVSRQWITVLVPPMVSTMARWDAATSLQLGSSGASPCKGATSMTKCPLPTKALPLFFLLNLAEIVQIRTVSLGMQEELLAQQTKHQ